MIEDKKEPMNYTRAAGKKWRRQGS